MEYHPLKHHNSASSHSHLYDKIQPSYFLAFSIILYVRIIAHFLNQPINQWHTHHGKKLLGVWRLD